VEGLSGEVQGGWHTQSEEGLRWGEKRGGGSLNAPLVAGGTRGKRGMGGGRRVATWRRRGAWPRRALELGAPDTSDVWSGSSSPGTAALGHTLGRQGNREKGERAGAPTSGPVRRVGPSCRERRRWEGEREADGWDRLGVGPAGRERSERMLTRGPAGFK
jgi:hypothetical protein